MGSWLRRSLDRVLDLETAAGLVGVGLLVLLQVPWLEGVLDRVGLRDSEGLRTALVALVLTSVLGQLRELGARISDVGAGVEQVGTRVSQPEERIHFLDPSEMYHVLLEQARSTTASEHRHLEVLGLTLYSAWPTISFWLQQPGVSGWTIAFTTLSPSARIASLPEDWPEESRSNATAIRRFAERPDVLERGLRITVAEYDFVPSVHGFRLGNGNIFISNLLWDGDGRLGKQGFSYEFVPASLHDVGAEAMRRLFDNWFTRAMG